MRQQTLWVFHKKAHNICFPRHFQKKSKTLPDSKIFNEVFDTPLMRVNEILYRRPEINLIKMMEDVKMYDFSKIIPIMKSRPNMYVDLKDTDDDTDSDEFILL